MRSHPRRGGAALEFALVLPILLVLVVGIIEYGWLFLQQSNVLSAVREGTRLGVTYATDDSPDPPTAAEASVQARLTSYGFDTSTATIDAVYEGASPEQMLRVTCSVPYQPLIGFRIAVPENLTGSMTMLLEVQD
ncbi:MAG: TadE/TadG family type IV pilus assembly protein [Pseudomonadota bacterium]|nr:TadE/TadG family type IV pilus assembly protein [Pseudomonadota bacterium]